MGTTRLFLALAVLLSHVPGGIVPKFMHPTLAVQIFYVISGFYIQFIINQYVTKENNGKGIRAFYTNRFLRIFPIYWVMLILTALLRYKDVQIGLTADLPTTLYFLFSNIFIIGLDIRGHIPFGFTFPAFFNQASTLVPEILFYLIAPFLLRLKATYIWVIILASILLRIVLYLYGFKDSIWHYFFFPSELATFLIGSLACRLYFFFENSSHGDIWQKYYTVLIIILIYHRFDHYLGGSYTIDNGVPNYYWTTILISAGLLPILFNLSKNLTFDRWLGDFSYEIYISHFFIIFLLEKLNFPEHAKDIQVICGTLILSWLLKTYIAQPIEHLRMLIKEGKKDYSLLNVARVFKGEV